ncbi:MAG TPA: hypothetical protein VEJ23_03980 [Solirubrobacteraceae bacterium]|nr:hypothetical protein [Solirubrobacteraceae bacterium]
MTQISRPFVIALAAVLLLAGVWFVALKPHASSSPETPASTPAQAPAPSGAAQEQANAAPSHVDHTSTPGLEGLTKDINRAHGAVAASQANGRGVEEKAAQVSGGTSASATSSPPSSQPTQAPSTSSPPTSATAPKTASAPSTSKTSGAPASVHAAAAAAAAESAKAAEEKAASEAAKAGASAGKETTTRIPANQALVEDALKEHKIAVLLFWNPHSAEDQVVRLSVGLIAGVHEIFEALQSNPETSRAVKQSGVSLPKIAVFEAGPGEVASFGSFTRSVQVLQTPTVLIVNPLGQVTSIPGYTETRAINQRIGESRETYEASANKSSQKAAK